VLLDLRLAIADPKTQIALRLTKTYTRLDSKPKLYTGVWDQLHP